MAIATVRTTHAASSLISSISRINVAASAEIYEAFVLVGAAHPLVAQTVFDERFDKHRIACRAIYFSRGFIGCCARTSSSSVVRSREREEEAEEVRVSQ